MLNAPSVAGGAAAGFENKFLVCCRFSLRPNDYKVNDPAPKLNRKREQHVIP
jgi:hypothetical protein